MWFMAKRRQHTKEFKEQAARLVVEQGVSRAQVARDLDVHYNLIRNWVNDYEDNASDAFPGHGKRRPEQEEIARLKKEVAKLKSERDILKKAAAFFARETK